MKLNKEPQQNENFKRKAQRVYTEVGEKIPQTSSGLPSTLRNRKFSNHKYINLCPKSKKEINMPICANVFNLKGRNLANTKNKKIQMDEKGSKITKPSNQSTVSENEAEKYQIEGIVGKGTFGVVYYGTCKLTGQKIAIKKVLQDKKYKNRELQILTMIKNQNLLQILDTYTLYEGQREYLHIVTEFYQYNLYQIIKKKLISPPFLKIIAFQILKGLYYLSSLNIAHRDVKPQNILFNPSTNLIVLCDFGSAKQLVKNENNLAYICSRSYRAPQLIFGSAEYTCQIDMWAFGCIFVEMITGELAFCGDSQLDQLIQIIKILGTPSKQEILQMNRKYSLKDYKKIPFVKKMQWSKVLKIKDQQLIDLISNILQYSPVQRYTPVEAMLHPYFDELRDQSSYKQLKSKLKTIPQIFNFSKEQLQSDERLMRVIPEWYGGKKKKLSKRIY